MKVEHHHNVPKLDHRSAPSRPDRAGLGGDSLPVPKACPGRHDQLGNFQRYFWGELLRHQHQDVARSFAGTDSFEQSRRDRRKIEMRFVHSKRMRRLRRLRLRGPRGAHDEFVLAAIARNLRQLALVARSSAAQLGHGKMPLLTLHHSKIYLSVTSSASCCARQITVGHAGRCTRRRSYCRTR